MPLKIIKNIQQIAPAAAIFHSQGSLSFPCIFQDPHTIELAWNRHVGATMLSVNLSVVLFVSVISIRDTTTNRTLRMPGTYIAKSVPSNCLFLNLILAINIQEAQEWRLPRAASPSIICVISIRSALIHQDITTVNTCWFDLPRVGRCLALGLVAVFCVPT